MNSDMRFYLSLAWRRSPLMLAAFVACTTVGLLLAMNLPTTYRTSAQLLVESPQIPDELAASTVQTNAAEQLEIIQQRLMTRANLIDIANRLEVFEDRAQMSADEVVREMEAQTQIRSSAGRDRATQMSVSFSAEDPQTAADVVNAYVTLVLEANTRQRTGQAEDTLAFFEQEVERLGRELDIQSERIVAFKNENADALPDDLEFRYNRQTALQEQIRDGQRRRTALAEQRQRLVQLYQETGSIGEADANLSAEARRLRDLQNELSSALSIYSETNPRVRVLRAQIEQLETVVAQQAGADEGASPLDIQLAQIDAESQTLGAEVERAEDELEGVNASIERTPANAIALDGLERDYANLQSQYNAAVGGLAAARTGERIEVNSKGQRITVLEAANAPTEPASPNRPVIAAGGAALGLGAAGGLFLILELLNRSVRRPSDIVSGLGITPIATIPLIETRTPVRRGLRLAALVVAAIAIPAAIWAVHAFYMPLDLLVDQALARIGP